MKIILSPQRRDDTIQVVKSGDALTINGVEYDFSVIPDGALLPRDAINCTWLVSDVERIDGVLHLTLILPHGAEAPHAVRFPSPLTDPADGPLEFSQ
jgi:hypothetical protein